MNKFLILLVKIYQVFISPFIGNNCRFNPSCSKYMIESIKLHGSIIGVYYGMIRILKCNPIFKGGNDFPKKNTKFFN